MLYKPELLTTAASLEELERLIAAGADAFVVGEARYAARMAGEFDQAAIEAAVRIASPHGVRVYVAVNNIIDNATLEHLPDYLSFLQRAGVDAIVFGDPSVLVAAKSCAPGIALHWNAEMTSTNRATAEYWARRGATRFVLARELNMEQIEDTKARSSIPVQVQVHGMTNIYHSKRSLVRSYLHHQGDGERLIDIVRGQNLYLMEGERPEERFPIFEDANGTHIMSSDDICMLENLHELMELSVESFKIEGIMKPIAYNEAAVAAYRQAIDSYAADPAGYQFREEWLDPIRGLQDPKRELSYGFFYKEQVY